MTASTALGRSPLEHRLRRLTAIVPVLAIVATAFGFWPRGMGLEIHPWNDGHPYLSDRASNAGGWALLAWTIVQIVIAAELRARATRKRGWWWFGLSVVATIGAAIGWIVEHFTLFDTWIAFWPGHVTAMFASAATLLVLVALPAILIVSSRTPPSAPEARVVEH